LPSFCPSLSAGLALEPDNAKVAWANAGCNSTGRGTRATKRQSFGHEQRGRLAHTEHLWITRDADSANLIDRRPDISARRRYNSRSPGIILEWLRAAACGGTATRPEDGDFEESTLVSVRSQSVPNPQSPEGEAQPLNFKPGC